MISQTLFKSFARSRLEPTMPSVSMPMKDFPCLFEACVDSLEDALAAERRGAQRIELCAALDQDGLTPAPELARQCVRRLAIPTLVMIRPRAGDFVYGEAEVRQMECDIEVFKALGVAGVVFGLLTPDNAIDMANTERLVRRARPLGVTFHKAIDATTDVLESFRQLNALDGITRVLTSGGRDTAWNGRRALKAMNDLAGRRIEIVAAGKLLPENRDLLADYTGVRQLHGKRIV
jgi:copper homeostasis protein